MNTRLLLIIFLTGSVFAKEPPDVECMVMHLKYVECLWKPTTNVNFTFYSGFYQNIREECESYIVEDGLNVGCQQSADDLLNKRFNSFYTKLVKGENVFTQEHQLAQLEPPSNLTVQYEPESKLSFKWNQIHKYCVENEVRYRVNYNNWETFMVRQGRVDYSIHLPSNNYRYEVQVRSRVNDSCGPSNKWSDWSEPVVWGSLKKPDVECMVMYLKYVECLWKLTTNVNFTFYSRFDNDVFRECESYIVEDGLNVGCQQSADDLMMKRFNSFETKLEKEEDVFTQKHYLKNRVKLSPPSNITVQYKLDSNLWYKWNQKNSCIESEIRYRVNYNNWETSRVSAGRSEYCINLPSNNSRYELQVRSKVSHGCGESNEWSDWSEPVVWGSHNSTESNRPVDSLNVWTIVMYAAGAITLVLLILMLLQHERIRIILIPVVPKPSLVPQDIEEWLDSSKGLKKVFEADYTERTCPVREYCPVPHSDSESSDSNISVSTDQTDFSGSMTNNDPNDLGSSSTNVFISPEEQHLSV